MAKPRCCRECGLNLPDTLRAEAMFCPDSATKNSPSCRNVWNNRRKARGADLYDFFMNMRYNRKHKSVVSIWKMACRMAQAWKEEDDAAGRVSFARPEELLQRHVQFTTDVVAKAHQVGR